MARPDFSDVAVNSGDQEDFTLDPADIMMGVILAVMLPAITYFVLGAVGAPPSGVVGVSTQEAAEMAQKEKERKPPPMTVPEFHDRIKLINELLAVNVGGFEQRYRNADGNYEKGRWLRKAMAVCRKCEHLLEELEKNLISPALKASNYAQEVRVYKTRVTQKLAELQKDAPFDF